MTVDNSQFSLNSAPIRPIHALRVQCFPKPDLAVWNPSQSLSALDRSLSHALTVNDGEFGDQLDPRDSKQLEQMLTWLAWGIWGIAKINDTRWPSKTLAEDEFTVVAV
ncbi:MAG: hypothetical protein KDE23_23200, partial [Caldilinea sp.]|nr:hypothetical protein [Caldilinea sp.]